jgi:hypothetical protein
MNGAASADDDEGGKGTAFQLHTVNATGRPYGDGTTPAEMDKIFLDKFGDGSTYDSFMDFNTGFYVANLDPYIKQLRDMKIPFHAIAWESKGAGASFTSILFQLPGGSQAIVEMASDTQTVLSRASMQASPYERILYNESLPLHYGKHWQNDSTAAKPIVQLGKVSHFTWNITRDTLFYQQVLAANLTHSYDNADGTHLRIFTFPWVNKIAQVHLVQRSDDATKGAFKVRDFENTLNRAHELSQTSHFCGFDKFFDHHW